MKPVAQTLFRPSEGDGAGNCLQAALASVLELPLDRIPNFAAMPKETWQRELDAWLAARGLAVLPLVNQGGMPWVPPSTWCLLVGESPRGNWNHVVVGYATEERFEYRHDPHPSGDFLADDPKEVWVFVVQNPAELWR